MASQYGHIMDLPSGYRFVPNDEELMEFYLTRKVCNGPLPHDVIKDVDASELYSKHPKTLVDDVYNHENSWYFFTHTNDDNVEEGKKTIRIVGDGIGFWRGLLSEDLIYNSNGDVCAFKTHWRYFEGPIIKGKRTNWTMEEYRLRNDAPTSSNDEEQLAMEWVLVRMKKGRVYDCLF
ncbi:NAC transcription factor 29-like [Olea europaea subsp. europaea]|nr:NAC transcription factor 29-like [Olea europaea subsp. europaea]